MKTLVILTGAGMSAESGISTFRDSGGLWEKYHIEDVATPEAWARNPALVQEFYNARRRQLVDAMPNKGHAGLVELEKLFDVQIITQNVDNLHERAGSRNVLHLHGELMKIRSAGPGQEVFEVQPEKIEFSIHDKCPKGYPLRPHIVWFGEDVPEIDNAARIVKKTDILVIIGTSMQVYPAAGLIHYARPGIPLYLIDPNEVEISQGRAIVIRKGASEGVKILKEELLKKI